MPDSDRRRGFRLAVFFAAIVAALAVAAPAQADEGAEVDRMTIIAAGDSIVMGAGAAPFNSWPEVLEEQCGASCDVKNVGHGGACLVSTGCWHWESLLDSFDREVLAHDPDLVIVGIGRNDLCHVSTRDLLLSYKELRARARAAGARIWFSTITPPSPEWRWPCEEQRIEVNTWLRTLDSAIDFERRVSSPRGFLRSEFDYGDGLHLNDRGYEVMGRLVQRQLSM